MKIIQFLLFVLIYNVSVYAYSEYVKVDCEKYTGHGIAYSIAPKYDFFRKLDENNLCKGKYYITSDEEIPEHLAQDIVDADPNGAFSITDYKEADVYKLDPIVLEAEQGNNPFSIPWNWLVKFLGLADPEVYEKIYEPEDLPICDPNNLSNEYRSYSETA